jgi:2-dehydro-3-deoxyphosphooctonate aldolase (KDO 8-P synthase)
MKTVRVGNVEIANDKRMIIIGGPDSLDDQGWALSLAKKIKAACDHQGVGYIFKASFDKANRTSISSFRGLGLEKGLEVLAAVKKEAGVPVTTDIHEPYQAERVAEVVDLIQIPALLSRQTDLIVAAAKTGRAVNIKKGQFLAPQDLAGAIGKAEAIGNRRLLVTERGTIFGYQNLIVDMRSLAIMKNFGYPVIFDTTHSVQLPSALGKSSGGQPEFIPVLSRAAVGVGVAGIFAEMYESRDKCLVDCDNSLPFEDFPELLSSLTAIDAVVKNV